MKKKPSKAITAYLSKIGKKGAKASVARRTPDEQQALARLGSRTRWKDHEYSDQPAAVYQRERRKKLKRAKETDDTRRTISEN